MKTRTRVKFVGVYMCLAALSGPFYKKFPHTPCGNSLREFPQGIFFFLQSISGEQGNRFLLAQRLIRRSPEIWLTTWKREPLHSKSLSYLAEDSDSHGLRLQRLQDGKTSSCTSESEESSPPCDKTGRSSCRRDCESCFAACSDPRPCAEAVSLCMGRALEINSGQKVQKNVPDEQRII